MTDKLNNQLQPTPDRFAELVTRGQAQFETRFGRRAEIVVAAPGRVNIIGEHIDYNDGYVLPMAIERYVVIAAALRDVGDLDRVHVFSADLGETAAIPLHAGNKPKTAGWARYIEGVLAGYAQRRVTAPAFDAVIVSDVPAGGGLSSSAAIEVATATLTEALAGEQLDPRERALICQRAEHKFAGVPCGFMDQFSSVFGEEGSLLFIDCMTQDVRTIPVPSDDLTVLITNSNVAHSLASSEYATRRRECEMALPKLDCNSWRDVTFDHLESQRATLKPEEYMRACHVVSETVRAKEAANAFEAGDWSRVGELMYASHESLRDGYEVSCAELDMLVATLRDTGTDGGVIGARMTGGGFGGCTVALVRAHAVDEVIQNLHAAYIAATGIEPESFTSRPARGAHVVAL